MRAARQTHGFKVRPLPTPIFRAILVLIAVAAVFLARTLPFLSPENVFRATQSRLQTPADVLFTRLSTLRPAAALTAHDLALRARLVSLQSRLLYLQFGPAVVAACPFCTPDDPLSYLYYFLPDLLAPHLFNLAVLAAATSSLLTRGSPAATRWRAPATCAAVLLAVADVYLVASYSPTTSARALRLGEMDAFFWDARACRLAGLALLDALLAALLYLAGTQRAFAVAPSPAERVEAAARGVAAVKSKVNAAGVVKNTVLRDEMLRGRSNAYWAHEVRLMRELMEEREVLEGVNDALANRIDIRGIVKNAEDYATAMLRPGDQGEDKAKESGRGKEEVVG